MPVMLICRNAVKNVYYEIFRIPTHGIETSMNYSNKTRTLTMI